MPGLTNAEAQATPHAFNTAGVFEVHLRLTNTPEAPIVHAGTITVRETP